MAHARLVGLITAGMFRVTSKSVITNSVFPYVHKPQFLLGCASRQEPPWCAVLICVYPKLINTQRSAVDIMSDGKPHQTIVFIQPGKVNHRHTSALQLRLIEAPALTSLRQASPPEDSKLKRIHILRHGQAIHKQVRVASSII
jgi:hypothetical protein